MDRAEYTNRIGILMNENDLSQDAFAASIGLNRDRVNNWLNGRSKLDVDSLKNISEKYNVSTDWVLGIAPIESRSPDVSIQGATAVTGLSEEAIHNIQVFKRKMKYGDIFSSDLSLLLESDKFIGIIPRIDELRFLYNKSADAVDYL